MGIIRYADGARVTAMRNPWREFKSVPLGKIFSRMGGGGHARVGSVILPASHAGEAPTVLNEVVDAIRSRTLSAR